MPVETAEELSPRPLMRILDDFAKSQIFDAALEYDFFTLIDGGFHRVRIHRDSFRSSEDAAGD